VTLRHLVLIGLGVAAFVLVSVAVARWLTTENRERAAVIDLLRAQAGGDVPAMLERLDGCAADAACRVRVQRNAAELAGVGKVRVLRLDSSTAHAVVPESGPTRVAWDVGGTSLPVVQCVEVERRGVPVLGGAIVLRSIGPKIGGEASC
jgi:hypothetical protein